MTAAGSRDLVSPDLLPLIDSFAAMGSGGSIEEKRARLAAMLAPTIAPSSLRSETTVPGPGGPLRLLIYRPADAAAPYPALLHIHGGGYTLGLPEMADARNLRLAERGILVASVDYRLAPEAPYPAALEDCHAALAWLHDQSPALGIDPDRIGVLGESAGGGHAAALALMARDRGTPLAFQWLIYPMIDDRTGSGGDPHPYAGHHVWTAADNRAGWQALLGREPGGPMDEPYAAAARAADFGGLPPTLIQTGALDLFVDEDLDFARRLIRAGVPTTLHVYPGAVHGYAFARASAAAEATWRDGCAALDRVLGA